jgi:hypothetical protein
MVFLVLEAISKSVSLNALVINHVYFPTQENVARFLFVFIFSLA